MVVPNFSRKEFFDYLSDHDWDVVSNDYWDEFDVVVFKNMTTGATFTISVKQTYFYPQIVKICLDLEIPPPEGMLKVYEQHKGLSSGKH